MKRQALLEGIRVTDLTTVFFGPYCTQTLADLGAEVVKLEPAEGDTSRLIGTPPTTPGMGPVFMRLNRGKRTVDWDLKSEAGREAMRRLIEVSDVFIHNIRTDAIGRAGLGYDEGRKIRPDIVYVHCTGFDETGPYAGLQAYHGGVQHLRGVAERRQALATAANQLRQTRQALAAADLPPPRVSGAGTGSFGIEAASGLWDEIQPGSFLFMDADYLRNERDPAQPRFEPALFVKAQVISASADRVVCDAGHKSHAIDSGLPQVHALPGQPALHYANGGDEHGILRPAEPGGALPALGDTLWLIPGHCDPTVNLHDHMIVVRGGLAEGVVDAVVPVDARGAW